MAQGQLLKELPEEDQSWPCGIVSPGAPGPGVELAGKEGAKGGLATNTAK
jgi:hypothetical protein